MWSRIKSAATTVKNVGVSIVSVASRTIYNTGQTFYSMTKVVSYFQGNGLQPSPTGTPPAGYAGIAIAMAGSATSTVMRNSVPTYDRLSSTAAEEEPTVPLRAAGKAVDYTLRGASLGYGGMSMVSAYFLSLTLSRGLDALVSSEPNTAAWKEAIMQVASVVVGLATLYNYVSNDYRFIKKNTHAMAESVDERSIPLDAAMAKTVGTSALNLITYPSQAYFFAEPALKGLPYIGSRLGPVGTNVLAGAASFMTLLTVISWLPSARRSFTASTQPQQVQNQVPYNCKSISYKIGSYISGAIDSLGGAGLGPFISIIFVANQLFGADPYNWIIGLAALCGLNAFFMNMMFSVKEGTNKTLEITYRQSPDLGGDDDEDLEAQQPLLGEESGSPSPSVYRKPTPGTVLFNTSADDRGISGTVLDSVAVDEVRRSRSPSPSLTRSGENIV